VAEEADKLQIAQGKIHALEQQAEEKDDRMRDLAAGNSELAFALSVSQSPAIHECREELPQFQNVHNAIEIRIHFVWGEGEKKSITGHGGEHPPIASD
jgi:hypothetical protein